VADVHPRPRAAGAGGGGGAGRGQGRPLQGRGEFGGPQQPQLLPGAWFVTLSSARHHDVVTCCTLGASTFHKCSACFHATAPLHSRVCAPPPPQCQAIIRRLSLDRLRNKDLSGSAKFVIGRVEVLDSTGVLGPGPGIGAGGGGGGGVHACTQPTAGLKPACDLTTPPATAVPAGPCGVAVLRRRPPHLRLVPPPRRDSVGVEPGRLLGARRRAAGGGIHGGAHAGGGGGRGRALAVLPAPCRRRVPRLVEVQAGQPAAPTPCLSSTCPCLYRCVPATPAPAVPPRTSRTTWCTTTWTSSCTPSPST
jgi:hypothetical protein